MCPTITRSPRCLPSAVPATRANCRRSCASAKSRPTAVPFAKAFAKDFTAFNRWFGTRKRRALKTARRPECRRSVDGRLIPAHTEPLGNPIQEEHIMKPESEKPKPLKDTKVEEVLTEKPPTLHPADSVKKA